MFQLPPVPSFDGLHPLIIHFPIALLFVAPLFVVIGAILKPRQGRPLLYSALLLMVVGTASIFLAVETGEAARKAADHGPAVQAMLEDHEELAESTRTTFTVLTVVFAAIVSWPLLRRRELGRLASTVLPLAFLLVYGAGMVLLANTADHGGRLVHQLGVHAMIGPAGQTPTIAQDAERKGEGDRDHGNHGGGR